ncbi:hypothetical protein [Azospirillum sp.]|uniref:hypothetical protein n=1 Tax=Azospirillum sp. TaxID=34012 RepID=UPI0026085B7F|nr:hypothetical protein [Azospirillum sp.]
MAGDIVFRISYQYINPEQNRADELFEHHSEGKEISEPVSEINEDDDEKILVFICLHRRKTISHLCWGRRGNRAGTALSRLNLERIERISDIDTKSLVKEDDWVEDSSFFDGRGIYRNANEALDFIKKLRLRFPDIERYINKSELDYSMIDKLSNNEKQIVVKEQDAIEMALRIGSITSRNTYIWSPTEQKQEKISSFFSGIKKKSLSEDDVIRYDLDKIPGFNVIKEEPFGYYLLESNGSLLHVFHANKNSLEHTLGVDLIYYNEEHNSFIFLQYKMAEPIENDHIFRIPDKQLSKEILRMDAALTAIGAAERENSSIIRAENFRITEIPFFLKICPRDEFDPDKYEQIKGMIVPLDMWKDIENDESERFFGPRGGKYVSFNNCPRYFDNTAFISLFRKGWIGTNFAAKDFLGTAIREIVEDGTSLIFAAKLPNSQEMGTTPTSEPKNTRKIKKLPKKPIA